MGYNPIGELQPGVFAGLANLNSLLVRATRLETLPSGVFDELESLGQLNLADNALVSLPPDIFAGLANLWWLRLNGNRLSELPPGLFEATPDLEQLYASGNGMIRVREGVFSGHATLSRLDLSGNRISELAPRAFAEMAGLEELRLSNNRLSSLPPGMFAGLAGLRYVWLTINPGEPFPLHAELVRADTSDLLAPGPAKVVLRVPSGAPFAFRLPLSVQRGEGSGAVLAVEAGDTVSGAVEITAAGTEAVHASLGMAPRTPAGFEALRIAPGGSLALFAEADNRPPVIRAVIPEHRLQADGPSARVALAGHFDDPDGDSLVYEVESGDPDVVAGRVQGGTLWLDPGAVDTTEIVVRALDGEGLRAAQRFRTWVVPAPDPDAFNIELVFGPGFTEEAKAEIRRAADRWTEVVVGDLPDVPVDGHPPEWCSDAPLPRFAGVVDDLVIFMQMQIGETDVLGWASRCARREESGLAFFGAARYSDVFHSDRYTYTFYETALHEIGHVLGIGYWHTAGRDTDPYFPGPLAVAAFDAAGGENYAGGKVPVENRDALFGVSARRVHWRRSVMPDDVMAIGRGTLLTAITVQALADLGHEVDVGRADPYTLPMAVQGDAARVAADAEIAAAELFADDVIRGAVAVVDRNGRVVRIIRP